MCPSPTEPTELDLDAQDESIADPAEALAGARSNPSRLGDALIPHGGAFEGQVAISGSTRIEGLLRGSLRGTGELQIGSAARVEGRVECDVLESDGEIVGPVSVRTRARFGAGARLDGDLEAPLVAFDDTAVWNGRATIGPHQPDGA